MANEQAKRDENIVTTLLGVTDDANEETRRLLVDPSTGRLKVSAVINSNLDDLNDVDAASPNDGDVLTYNSGSGNWEAQAPTATTLTEETPSGTVDGSNTSFTVNNDPVFVVIDGMFRVEGQGYTYSGGTITVDSSAPPMNWIRSFYNA